MMKAARYYGPGDVRIEQAPYPPPPKGDEVLLHIVMGSLCGTDASQFERASMVPLDAPHPSSGHQGPLILGHEVVGIVTLRGDEVDQLELGQRVVPGAGMWCGECAMCRQGRMNICERYFLYGIHANGGLAEMAIFPAKMCVPVPELCATQAAAIAQPCAVALHALSRARLPKEGSVALFGAGSIGCLMLACMQVEQTACRVIAVDIDADRLTTAARLGAEETIHANTQAPVQRIREFTQGRGVDVAIEATGNPKSIADALASVRRGGRLLLVGIPHGTVYLPLVEAVTQEKEIVTTNGQVCNVDLPHALRLLATTDLAERIGSHTIPFESLVRRGLVPLIEHTAASKILIQVSTSSH